MLADKVEAATRTLKHPDEANIRLMISRIVSSVITDGQFTECPLTFQEINTVAETFVSVLMGIYHQRIEYPQTADVSQSGSPDGVPAPLGRQPPKHAIITLELVPSDAGTSDHTIDVAQHQRAVVLEADDESSDVIDYESLEHLPTGEA